MSPETTPNTPETPAPAEPKDHLVITRHSLTLPNRHVLNYTVTCGTLVLKQEREKDGKAEGEKPAATLFFTAYTLDQQPPEKRPITFSFNGGPGSSSVWLHIGLLGPRRLQMGDAGNLLPPPYTLTDNEYTLLDATDLVFIDPVGTGYSRPHTGEGIHDLHTFTKDIESVGDFIRLYCSRYQRWASPKYLIGESYGTTRAAGLSGYLQQRYGMYLNGLMLVSMVLDFSTIQFQPGHDLPHLLLLPTCAAVAHYHRRLPAPQQSKPLRALLDEVETFVKQNYLPALMEGDALPAERRSELASKIAQFTGVSAEYVLQNNLRLETMRFAKELLRSEGRTIGRLDGRFTAQERDRAAQEPGFDPSYAAILGPYSGAFNHYIRAELNYENDLPYEILSFKIFPAWRYDEHENRFVNVGETLREAITQNPALRVLIANGYYDFATPYFAAEYTVNHLALADELHANIRMTYYEAGHMMYVHQSSLEQLSRDLHEFIEMK